eukprot:GHVS01107440.1.p3 GENE.GHVS01107440.1~~GHVS01107440.1.p3  ORF type:complete len:102 (+),score=34.68 GHVS01107440.1:486-791(+)
MFPFDKFNFETSLQNNAQGVDTYTQQQQHRENIHITTTQRGYTHNNNSNNSNTDGTQPTATHIDQRHSDSLRRQAYLLDKRNYFSVVVAAKFVYVRSPAVM